MRYRSRGADPQGNVANFVETEQIVAPLTTGQSVASFGEIRGSVPIVWTQADKGFKPPPVR